MYAYVCVNENSSYLQTQSPDFRWTDYSLRLAKKFRYPDGFEFLFIFFFL